MVILRHILFHKRSNSNLFDKRHIILSNLARWYWGCSQPCSPRSSNPIGNIIYENILFVPIWQTCFQTSEPHVHQTIRKLLRVCFASFPLNIFNPLLLSNKSMAYWYYGFVLSWCQWLFPYYGEGIQSKYNWYLRIIRSVTKNYCKFSISLLRLAGLQAV